MVATFLNSFVNHAHIVKIANMAQTGERDRAHFHQREGDVPADHLLPAAAIRSQTPRGQALETFVDCPTYDSKHFGKTAYLDVPTSLNQRVVTMNVVNRHLDQDVEAEIEVQDGAFGGAFEVFRW